MTAPGYVTQPLGGWRVAANRRFPMASRDASPEHDQEDRRQPGRSAKTWRDKAWSRVLTAALSLLFTGLVLILPPIVNKQLAGDEHLL